ncbi:MAG: DUF4837 family protein [Balneolales bacterium]|nr:DUF4837 family protein [Balneolales bacterium]
MIFKYIRSFLLLLILAFSLLVSACEGDYRQEARGGYSEVLVVMDSTAVNSETALALRQTYGAPILTMPRPESRYDLVFRDVRTNRDLEIIHGHRNVIIAAVIDEDTNAGALLRSLLSEEARQNIRNGNSFSYTARNVWSRNQFVIMLSAATDEELASLIRRNERRLIAELHSVELDRWKAYVYRRAEQVNLSREILQEYGWSFRLQHDYRIGVDTLGMMTFRRFLPDNDRWIWVWWEDDFDDFDSIDRDWITNKREKINRQYMRGGSEGKFVRTDFDRPYEQRFLEINGMEAYESRGLWRMENDLMGGPFINYTMYDHENNRLFMMEYGQFSPRWDQRRFLYQFEAMARTFVSNPDAIVPRDER